MGLPVLKEAFEAVRATPVPFELLPSEDDAGFQNSLAEILARATDGGEPWRSRTRRLIIEVPVAAKHHVEQGGNVQEVVTDLERLREELADRLEKLLVLAEHASGAADAVHDLAKEAPRSDADTILDDAILNQAALLHDLARSDFAIGSNFLDVLTATIADIDPAASGGPAFDDAEDLIAYLDR